MCTYNELTDLCEKEFSVDDYRGKRAFPSLRIGLSCHMATRIDCTTLRAFAPGYIHWLSAIFVLDDLCEEHPFFYER